MVKLFFNCSFAVFFIFSLAGPYSVRNFCNCFFCDFCWGGIDSAWVFEGGIWKKTEIHYDKHHFRV